MGDAIKCRATFNGRVSHGNARLEPDKLTFKGDFRVGIALTKISALSAKAGNLTVVFPEGTLTLELGSLAEKWSARIRSPKSLIDKLGVKANSKLMVLGIEDESFGRQVKEMTAQVTSDPRERECDMVFLSANSLVDLQRLTPLQTCMKRNGFLWVVYPKGKSHIKEKDVIGAGKEARLVDTKVVSFSETHTALKFVIPLSSR